MSIITKDDLDFYLPSKLSETMKKVRASEIYVALEERVHKREEGSIDELVEFISEITYRCGMQESFALAAAVTKLVDDGVAEYREIYHELLEESAVTI